jgi:hypothetical protein
MIKKYRILKMKMKLYGNIVKLETNKGPAEKVRILNVEGKWIQNKQTVVETFNNYFYQSLKIEKEQVNKVIIIILEIL